MDSLREPLPEISLPETEASQTAGEQQAVIRGDSADWYTEAVLPERQQALRRASLLTDVEADSTPSYPEGDRVVEGMESDDNGAAAFPATSSSPVSPLDLSYEAANAGAIPKVIAPVLTSQVNLVLDSRDVEDELTEVLQEDRSTTESIITPEDPPENEAAEGNETEDRRNLPDGQEAQESVVESAQFPVDMRFVPIDTWNNREVHTVLEISPNTEMNRSLVPNLEDVRLIGPNGRRRRYNPNRNLEADDYVSAVSRERRHISPLRAPVRRNEQNIEWSPSRRQENARCQGQYPVKLQGTMFGVLRPIQTDPTIDPPPHSCFNCWKFDHARSNCRQPKSNYCYNCGRKDVQLMTCPRCKDAYEEFARSREQPPRGRVMFRKESRRQNREDQDARYCLEYRQQESRPVARSRTHPERQR